MEAMVQNTQVVWCATAFQGKFLDAGDAPYVSTIQEVTSFGPSAGAPKSFNQFCLTVVHNAIDAQMRHRRPLDPNALIKPFMTVSVDRFPALEDIGDVEAPREHIARLDMIMVGRIAYGGIWVEGVGEAELDPVHWTDGEGIWEIAVPLLRQVGELDFDKPEAD